MHSAGPCELTTVKADLLKSRERLSDALIKTTGGMPPSEARTFLLDLALLSLDAAVEAIDDVMHGSFRGGDTGGNRPASTGSNPYVLQRVDP